MLTIHHLRHWYEPKLPHAVFINGQFVGMMKDHDMRIEMPAGSYSLKVQFEDLFLCKKTVKVSICQYLQRSR